MKKVVALSITVLVCGLLLPLRISAQSTDSGEVPLGDLARTLRKDKNKAQEPKAAPAPVIDDDNFQQIVEAAQKNRVAKGLLYTFDNVAKAFQVSAPDVTCNLSFSANMTPLLSDPYAPQDLPAGELAKLDGPAVIHGDTLEVSVLNGSSWNLREITVVLTILRTPDGNNAYSNAARLMPASVGETIPEEKRSDVTMLLHLKANGPPNTTTTFQEIMDTPVNPDQEWHWSIVQARGIPPK